MRGPVKVAWVAITGAARNKKKNKNESRGGLRNFIFENLKANQFTGLKYKKEKRGRQVADSHVLSILITMAELNYLSYAWNVRHGFYQAGILSFLNYKF